MKDFEDAVLYQAGIRHGCQVIITCNGKDFSKSSIPVMTPDETVSLLQNRH